MDGIWLTKLKDLEAWELQISMSSDFSCSIRINSSMMGPEHKKEASFLILFYQQGAFKRFTNRKYELNVVNITSTQSFHPFTIS